MKIERRQDAWFFKPDILKMPFSMQVLKRNGISQPVAFDKVLGRVRKAARGLQVNPDALAQQVLAQIVDGVKTSELDELTAQLAASLSTLHPRLRLSRCAYCYQQPPQEHADAVL